MLALMNKILDATEVEGTVGECLSELANLSWILKDEQEFVTMKRQEEYLARHIPKHQSLDQQLGSALKVGTIGLPKSLVP